MATMPLTDKIKIVSRPRCRTSTADDVASQMFIKNPSKITQVLDVSTPVFGVLLSNMNKLIKGNR